MLALQLSSFPLVTCCAPSELASAHLLKALELPPLFLRQHPRVDIPPNGSTAGIWLYNASGVPVCEDNSAFVVFMLVWICSPQSTDQAAIGQEIQAKQARRNF